MPRNPDKVDYSGGFPPFFHSFEQLEDPRSGGNTKHHFGEIIFMAFTSILCGVSTYELMEEFCEINEHWLRNWLKLPHGTPSNDTFSSVFESIEAEKFAECITLHLEDIGVQFEPQQIAIDGKSLRGSSNTQDRQIHSVSAWACDQGLTVAQTFTREKSNEITAIPKLLNLLNIEGCVVTIDAMGAQADIAQAIIKQRGDYVLSVKGNQKSLLDEISDQFLFASKSYNKGKLNSDNWDMYLSEEISRGREESRFTLVCHNLEWMNTPIRKKWQGLRSIVMIERKTICENNTQRKQVAFYMSSLEKPKASQMHNYIRNHWSIENSCHWVIDVNFKEDSNQVSQRNSAKNLSIMRRIALNTLKTAPETSRTKKPASLTKKQLRAAQDTTYREQCLNITP